MTERTGFLQFGAGNIGRSFLGQLFARGGYHVTFVDVDTAILEALRQRGRYSVVIRESSAPDRIIDVENVSAVDARDSGAVARACCSADLGATAVGSRALPSVMKTLASGLQARVQQGIRRPMDIILAENLRDAAAHCRELLENALPSSYPREAFPGLVETSIGKMVPLMRDEDKREDPLRVVAEPYNTLIVDALAFRNPIPQIPGLAPKRDMAAYVDRKLFIHNLGHAAAAYLGCRHDPAGTLLWQVLENPVILNKTRACMRQGAEALLAEYPGEFTRRQLEDHINDLLRRFRNRALGDTVYRVGRDLQRKLSREDRLVGAMRLAERHNCPYDAIVDVYRAALQFDATDEEGNRLPEDDRFLHEVRPRGVQAILDEVSGLHTDHPVDRAVRKRLQESMRAQH